MSSEGGVTTEGVEVTRGRLLEVWPQKCVFVVEEILKTEQDYVASLRQIIEGYLKPMHSHLFEHAESPLSIAAVFGNITQLHEFNTALEEELKASQDNPAAYGQVFVRNRDKFMYYAEYCTNYKTAVKYLGHLIDHNPHLGTFIAQCQKNIQHSFSLHDRLLKPVQRILKYQLLLENLLKPLSPDHCGYTSISEARTCMTDAADHINKMVKVQEVYSALHHESTVPLKKMASDKELVHEGVCRVGKSRELELVLFQKLLLFFKKEEDRSYTYEDHILAGELYIEEDPKDQKHFTISSTKQTSKKYSLHVQLSDDRQVWVDKIGLMKTDKWQNTIALERKKTVQNLSRLKLQASRRESIQICRQNKLAGRLSVPDARLDSTEQESRERTDTTSGLRRTKAVRLRKVLSTDCTSSSQSWLTSNQWRLLSPHLAVPHVNKLAHNRHSLQTIGNDHSNDLLTDNDIHVSISIDFTDATNGMNQCSPDDVTCQSQETPNQLPDDRPHPPTDDRPRLPKPDNEPHPPKPDDRPHLPTDDRPHLPKPDDEPHPPKPDDRPHLPTDDRPHLPKPDDEPHPFIVDDGLSLTDRLHPQHAEAHPPDMRPHPPSPDSRHWPPPSSNNKPHPPHHHDNEIAGHTVSCIPSEKTLNGKCRIKVSDYLLKKNSSSLQSDQYSNHLEVPSSPGHPNMPPHSHDNESSDPAEQQLSMPILYDCDSLAR